MRIKNPVSAYLEKSRRQSDEYDALRQKEKKNIAVAKGLGTEEANIYRTGELRAPQKELMEEMQSGQDVRTEEYAERAKLNEEQIKAMKAKTALDRQIMEESMREDSWKKAITSLGYSMEHTTGLIASYREEQQQTQAGYMALMGAIGNMGVMAMTRGMSGGGGAGAATGGGGSFGYMAGVPKL